MHSSFRCAARLSGTPDPLRRRPARLRPSRFSAGACSRFAGRDDDAELSRAEEGRQAGLRLRCIASGIMFFSLQSSCSSIPGRCQSTLARWRNLKQLVVGATQSRAPVQMKQNTRIKKALGQEEGMMFCFARSTVLGRRPFF